MFYFDCVLSFFSRRGNKGHHTRFRSARSDTGGGRLSILSLFGYCEPDFSKICLTLQSLHFGIQTDLIIEKEKTD